MLLLLLLTERDPMERKHRITSCALVGKEVSGGGRDDDAIIILRIKIIIVILC